MKHAFAAGVCDNTIAAARINGKKHGPTTIIKAIESTMTPVIDSSNGKIYRSIKDAADALGYDADALRRKLRGIYKNKTSLRYLNVI
jgi:hypothetical protein